MKSRIKLLCLCMTLIMMFLVSGCQLAKEEGQVSSDRFIGIYITMSPLKEMAGDSVEEDKIYAELKIDDSGEEIPYERYKYTFDDYDGIPLFQVTFSEENPTDSVISAMFNEAVSDVKQNIIVTDESENYKLEGTVFFLEETTVYCNPVYQENDGDVYMIPENEGRYVNEGGINTQCFGEKAIDGNEMSVDMEFIVKGTPEYIEYTGISDTDGILWKETYKPDEVPDSVEISKGTKYVIVDMMYDNGCDTEIYTEDDEVAVTSKKGKATELWKVETKLNWK